MQKLKEFHKEFLNFLLTTALASFVVISLTRLLNFSLTDGNCSTFIDRNINRVNSIYFNTGIYLIQRTVD